MVNNTPRYLIENEGANYVNSNNCIAEATNICRLNNIDQIILVAPTKGHFETIEIAKVLGANNSKLLAQGKSISVSKVTIRLEGMSSIKKTRPNGLIIGAYLPLKDMGYLDSLHSIDGIVFLPWTEQEGKEWLNRWNPTILVKTTWQYTPIQLSSVVTNALQKMSSLTPNLLHSSDKIFAKKILKDLKAAGEVLSPEGIYDWAVNNNWHHDHALSLKKLIR